MTGLFVIAPIFGRRNMPVYFKIGFAFLLSLILVNTIKFSQPDYSNSIYEYFILIFREFMVGITIGYVAYVIFSAIYMAGQLIDTQIGFGIVNVLDPVSNIQVPLTANFYYILSMVVLLSVNGHHAIIRALFDSYKSVPLGKAVFNTQLLNDVLRVFGSMFLIGFKIAAPIAAAILVVDVALGVISKAIPQMNVFVVGMPLKILVGIVVMMVTIPMFMILLDTLFNGMNSEMLNFLKDMGTK
jgi:flagellar biosynthetic protein FliR